MEVTIFSLAGFAASVAIGIALGLIGGGGSILTVPVLVYLFAIEPVVATAYSLFIVGLTAAVGSVDYFRQGLVDVRTSIVFGLPSIVAVFLTRAFIVPAIPEEVGVFKGVAFTKGMLMMVLFAVLMIAASFSMIRKSKKKVAVESGKVRYNAPLILVEGTVVGVLTGLVGAGGGFLIIPALVLLSRLPMKKAVGTSLVIISLKSLIGFLGEGEGTDINWPFLLLISSFAIGGIFIGSALSRRINGDKLKPAFGWFVLIMGIFIIAQQIIASLDFS